MFPSAFFSFYFLKLYVVHTRLRRKDTVGKAMAEESGERRWVNSQLCSLGISKFPRSEVVQPMSLLQEAKGGGGAVTAKED